MGFRTVCATAILGVALAAGPLAAGQLTVRGDGEAMLAPDMAILNLSVSRDAALAQKAVEDMGASANSVLEALKGAGVAERDIQSSALTLSPVWEQRDASVRPPRVVRYIAETQFTVTLRDIDGIGRVLDAVMKDGATGFNGLSFALTDPTAAEDEARAAAVADARRKADLMAEAAGVELGPLVSLSESGVATPQPIPFEMARSMKASDVPVAAGELSLSASVTMVYETLDNVTVPEPQ